MNTSRESRTDALLQPRMRTWRDEGRLIDRLGTLSHAVDWAAPAIVVLLTAFLLLERTPSREPLLYGAMMAMLGVLTWVSARSRGAYGLWAIYIGGFALFSLLRSFTDETGIPTHIGDLVEAEKAVAFGTVPTVWLQQRFFDPTDIGWLDRATTYVHWSYFALPHIFAAYLYFQRRDLFQRYVLLFVGVLAVGLVVYTMFPAAPPWVASLRGQLDPTYKVVTEVGSELNVNIYQYFDNRLRDSNPVAAMPSIHMAVSFAVLLIAFRRSFFLGFMALLYNVAMAFSLVYAGEHYIIDIAAGMMVTLLVYGAIELWFHYRERAGPAMAPLEAGPEPLPLPLPQTVAVAVEAEAAEEAAYVVSHRD
jgi:membrane-associated phospholipid phosphatase